MLNSKKYININLPASKSISNRVLIIRKICNENFEITNLSKAHDTLILNKILNYKNKKNVNVEDAGTVFRFLTAYYAFSTHKTISLNGTRRLQQRPIEDLVNALNSIGANIRYATKAKFAPIEILPSICTKKELIINANISSQFISALCMVAPSLPCGLKINMVSKIVSQPYINMTLQLMKYFGIKFSNKHDSIFIKSQKYRTKNITIENDWSSACYFYCLCVLDSSQKFVFNYLDKKSVQGDSIISKLLLSFGIESKFNKGKLYISNNSTPTQIPNNIDCTNFPDLAIPLIVMCGLKFGHIKLTGLSTLVNKESNRILALQQVLLQVGIKLKYENDILSFDGKLMKNIDKIVIETHDDHRIAMCSLLLKTVCKKVELDNYKCVNKSFPDFWKETKPLY